MAEVTTTPMPHDVWTLRHFHYIGILVIDKKNFEKYKNQFIALREQVEAEITDRQASLLEQAKAEKEAERVKKKAKEDLKE